MISKITVALIAALIASRAADSGALAALVPVDWVSDKMRLATSDMFISCEDDPRMIESFSGFAATDFPFSVCPSLSTTETGSWIVAPSPLARALWPNGETELCNFIHRWEDTNSELSIAENLILEIRQSGHGYTVSLLSSRGVFPQFETKETIKPVQSSLFLPCRAPLFLQSKVAEMEEIINSPEAKRELRIQRFLETKSQFLRVLGFQRFSPQVHLIRQDIDGNPNKRANLYPDFLVEDLGIRRHAVMELKRAQETMTAGPADRRTFSAKLHRALSQLEDYSMFFEDSRNRAWFEETYGVEIAKPELILVIGNNGLSSNFPPKIAHTPIESRPVRVLTYDYILNLVRAHHLVLPDAGEDLERG